MNIERIEELKQIRARLLDEHKHYSLDIEVAEGFLEEVRFDIQAINDQLAALTGEFSS